LIIGGGGAGLRAAIAVAETNPKLNIGVISKVYPMRSHTVSAEGGGAAVIKPNDGLDDHAYDTISGGDWLCDQDAVDVFVKLDIAEAIRPHGNDDALLRWNTCARIMRQKLGPREEEYVESFLE